MAYVLWVLSLFFVLFGTWLALRRLWGRRDAAQVGSPGISVLKPLKGMDPGLERNLESFFLLDHPDYELLFSVADPDDPALGLVQSLRRRHPDVASRVFIGAEETGLNPKVNNLMRPYVAARHDLVLISDSNVRVPRDYLRRKESHMKEGVGVVTSAVAGIEARSLGGMLEASYLNTFYLRGMSLAFAAGRPCVIGKSMMFRRSVAERFGGLASLSSFLAEDFALGEEMRKLGLTVELSVDTIAQYIGAYSFRSFWDRHLRWGRIRKAHAPLAFLLEPLFTPALSGLAASAALAGLLPAPIGYGLHLLLWCACDLLLMRKVAGKVFAWAPAVWLLRELLALPLWLAAASGSSVLWRGNVLRLAYGGRILEEGKECESLRSSGEPLPARIRLRGSIAAATGGSGRPRAILREG